MKIKEEKIAFSRVMFGCDPEFFFSNKGEIIGAEKVIAPEGLEYEKGTYQNLNGSTTGGKTKIIIDGVQAELNPRPDPCRARLGNEISACFRTLYETMKKQRGIKLDFSPTVSVSEKEMETLSEKAKQFGCAPSKNVGGKNKIEIKDASKYLYRSAGGHIHIGDDGDKNIKKVLGNAKTLVPILDIIVGNTCVLLDRDNGNIERRKVYGRAGEYRIQPHGIEYRTLSNFWLRSYQLMSMVMGLTRQAVCVVNSGFAKEILKAVDIEKIRRAINENNFELAYENFMQVLPILLRITPEEDLYPIHNGNKDQFFHFVDKGIDYWFKHDILKHWLKLPEGHDIGFESFLEKVVQKDINKKIIKK